MKASSIAMIALMIIPATHAGPELKDVERRRIPDAETENAVKWRLLSKHNAAAKLEGQAKERPSVPLLIEAYLALVEYRDELLSASRTYASRKPVEKLETEDKEYADIDQKCAMLRLGMDHAASAIESMAEESLARGDVPGYDRLNALALKARVAVQSDEYSNPENYGARAGRRSAPADDDVKTRKPR